MLDRLTGQESAYGDQSPQFYRCVFWADVPASRQVFYAAPTATSAWKDATPADVSALQSGAVVERVVILGVDPANVTLAKIQAAALAAWQSYQNEITAANPWARYGSICDAAGVWTMVTVA